MGGRAGTPGVAERTRGEGLHGPRPSRSPAATCRGESGALGSCQGAQRVVTSRTPPALRLPELSLGLDVESTWARPLNNPLQQDGPSPATSAARGQCTVSGGARWTPVGGCACAQTRRPLHAASPSRPHPPENISTGVRIPALEKEPPTCSSSYKRAGRTHAECVLSHTSDATRRAGSPSPVHPHVWTRGREPGREPRRPPRVRFRPRGL